MKFTDDISVLLTAELPATTKTYKAINHMDLHNMTVDKLNSKGLTVVSNTFKTNAAATQVIALYTIDMGDPMFAGMIGWRNSYDKQTSVAITAGSQVFICGNGCVVGTTKFIHKHNGSVLNLIEPTLEDQVNSLATMMADSRRLYTLLSQRRINDWFRNAVLGDLFMQDYLNTYQITLIKNEYKKPTYDYGHPGTVWELFNHCTHAMKTTNVVNYFEHHAELRKYMESL